MCRRTTGPARRAVTTRYNNGAAVSGTLAANRSSMYVYYSGQVDWSQWWCSDSTVGRYSSNTNSTTAVTRGGTISALPGITCGGSDTRVRSKVCRDTSYAPDPCGSWSSKY